MKRLIAAAVLLLSIIGIYLYSYYYTERICDKAGLLLEDCITAYDKGANANTAAKKLNEYWDSKEKPLSVVANHARIDEIELAISSLVIYSSTPETEIFHEYSGTVKTLLHQLMEDTVPSVHSIL